MKRRAFGGNSFLRSGPQRMDTNGPVGAGKRRMVGGVMSQKDKKLFKQFLDRSIDLGDELYLLNKYPNLETLDRPAIEPRTILRIKAFIKANGIDKAYMKYAPFLKKNLQYAFLFNRFGKADNLPDLPVRGVALGDINKYCKKNLVGKVEQLTVARLRKNPLGKLGLLEVDRLCKFPVKSRLKIINKANMKGAYQAEKQSFNPWITYVKRFAAHYKISYAQALHEARPSYRKLHGNGRRR